MSKNKNRQIRQQLTRLYGEGCFFERAHIAEKIEQMGGIKTYKTFLEEKKEDESLIKNVDYLIKNTDFSKLNSSK